MRHFLQLCFLSLLTCVLFVACGRSGIDDFELGGGDGGACGPETCLNGCCDELGQCRSGTDLTRCGTGGAACRNCPSNGFSTCSGQTCGSTPDVCNSATCPNGCCAVRNGRPVCLAGIDDTACGGRGETCASCSAQGQACNPGSRSCAGAVCNAQNCRGCCVGNQCLQGINDRACGRNGGQCSDCRSQGQTCASSPPAGGQCQGAPACNAGTCPNGCCVGNMCVPGTDNALCGRGGATCRSCAPGTTCDGVSRACVAAPRCGPGNCAGCCVGDTCVNPGNGDTSCGLGGAACANCTGMGQVCSAGKCENSCSPASCPNGCCQGGLCVVGSQDDSCGTGGAACTNCAMTGRFCAPGKVCREPCGPGNCAGCCQGNVCNAGFVNARCGSGGAACTDCSAAGQSCDVNSMPRVCSAAGTCPTSYPACPPGTSTAPPTPQSACPAFSLQDARVACAGGPNSASCISFFQFLNLNDPTCGACLSPFRFDFASSDGRGIYACVSPLVDATCNGATGCATDCENKSCAQCTSSAASAACHTSVRGTQCQSFVLGTSCITGALVGPAAFCNPATYGGSFGAWLEGVGGRYCNP
jgi:hypothetical protein